MEDVLDVYTHPYDPVRPIELGILQRQCLDRRLGDRASLTGEVAAWVVARNTAVRRIDWRFTTADARIKLKRLYPTSDHISS